MFARLLGKIATALNKFKIPYMVIGGQAVLVYGEPRATKDIDAYKRVVRAKGHR